MLRPDGRIIASVSLRTETKAFSKKQHTVYEAVVGVVWYVFAIATSARLFETAAANPVKVAKHMTASMRIFFHCGQFWEGHQPWNLVGISSHSSEFSFSHTKGL